MRKIITAQPLKGYRLTLRFDEGTEGVADLSDLAGKGVFAAWLKPGAFESVRVTEMGAVEWEGEIDLCPDMLYLRVTGKSPEEIFPVLRATLQHA